MRDLFFLRLRPSEFPVLLNSVVVWVKWRCFIYLVSDQSCVSGDCGSRTSFVAWSSRGPGLGRGRDTWAVNYSLLLYCYYTAAAGPALHTLWLHCCCTAHTEHTALTPESHRILYTYHLPVIINMRLWTYIYF